MRRIPQIVGWALASAWLVTLAAGCAGSSDPAAPATTGASGGTSQPPGAAGTGSSVPATAGTGSLVAWKLVVVGEQEVNPGYRQGIAKATDGPGWVFSTNNGLYRTGDDYQPAAVNPIKAEPAIPAVLSQQGYNHIGDIDIAGDTLWAPIEKEDKSDGRQVMARYDARTLTFIDSYVVPQHHNSFVAVGPDGTLYSTDQFDDDTILRYRFTGTALEQLSAIRMSQKVGHIQGADFAAGGLWLSTDDDHDGVYRVDLTIGAVQDLGSMGHADGEGEGIDAQEAGNAADLRTLSADAALTPMRVIRLAATPST